MLAVRRKRKEDVSFALLSIKFNMYIFLGQTVHITAITAP